MSTAATAVAQSSPVNQVSVEQKMKLQSQMRAGAGWLMAVAIFSVLNSALMMFDAKLHFIVGLGITQIADGIGKVGGTAGGAAGLVITLIVAGVFLVFWKFAREGQPWAFLNGSRMITSTPRPLTTSVNSAANFPGSNRPRFSSVASFSPRLMFHT